MRPAEKRMKKVDLKLLKYIFINYSEKDKVDWFAWYLIRCIHASPSAKFETVICLYAVDCCWQQRQYFYRSLYIYSRFCRSNIILPRSACLLRTIYCPFPLIISMNLPRHCTAAMQAMPDTAIIIWIFSMTISCIITIQRIMSTIINASTAPFTVI